MLCDALQRDTVYLFTPRCSPTAREFPRSVNFSLRHTVVELRSVPSRLPNFRILAYFLYTKPLKCTFGDQSTTHRLHRRMIPIFPCGSWRSKGVPSRTGDFLQLLVGELGTPKLAQIFIYGKWLYPYIMLLHGASDLDQRCLKMSNSEDECTFLSNIFIPTPKITPKPHFRGPFDAKLIMQRALRQSNVNGATTLKLYGYRGIGKYLGCVRIFPLAGIWGVQGPLMLIWDPPIISETIGARK